jgi:flagellar P-ring protein FlgI
MARIATTLLVLLLATVAATQARAQIMLRDLVSIEGVRGNQLVGYGLVVGLQATGDTLRNVQFTQQSLTAMLERMGVNVTGLQLQTRNAIRSRDARCRACPAVPRSISTCRRRG